MKRSLHADPALLHLQSDEQQTFHRVQAFIYTLATVSSCLDNRPFNVPVSLKVGSGRWRTLTGGLGRGVLPVA